MEVSYIVRITSCKKSCACVEYCLVQLFFLNSGDASKRGETHVEIVFGGSVGGVCDCGGCCVIFFLILCGVGMGKLTFPLFAE